MVFVCVCIYICVFLCVYGYLCISIPVCGGPSIYKCVFFVCGVHVHVYAVNAEAMLSTLYIG